MTWRRQVLLYLHRQRYPYLYLNRTWWVNTLRTTQNGRHFADDIFKCIFLNENIWIPIKISLKFVPNGPINNIPSLVQMMVWRRPGAKQLSEPMMVSLLTHICVTRPQWVNDWVHSVQIHQDLRPFLNYKVRSPLRIWHECQNLNIYSKQPSWGLHFGDIVFGKISVTYQITTSLEC